MYSLVLVSKGFFGFVGIVCVRGFILVLYVCQSFGCQKVASGPLFWSVRDFKV